MAVAARRAILWLADGPHGRRGCMVVARFLHDENASASILDEANGSWSRMVQEIGEGGRMP